MLKRQNLGQVKQFLFNLGKKLATYMDDDMYEVLYLIQTFKGLKHVLFNDEISSFLVNNMSSKTQAKVTVR